MDAKSAGPLFKPFFCVHLANPKWTLRPLEVDAGGLPRWKISPFRLWVPIPPTKCYAPYMIDKHIKQLTRFYSPDLETYRSELLAISKALNGTIYALDRDGRPEYYKAASLEDRVAVSKEWAVTLSLQADLLRKIGMLDHQGHPTSRPDNVANLRVAAAWRACE